MESAKKVFHKKSCVKRLIILVLFGLSLLGSIVLVTHNVSRSLTDEDRLYISKILSESGYNKAEVQNSGQFDAQIQAILKIQKSAFDTSPVVGLIEKGTPREPKDIYYSDKAFCGDRARYLDKALRAAGFKSRYASIYRDDESYSILGIMLRPGSDPRAESHALVEVMTQKGWLIVDTRHQWISLTEDNAPIDLKELRDNGNSYYQWNDLSTEEPWPLLKEKYHIFYGLYSRHGQFYAPYTPYVPDINWSEFLNENLSELF